MGRNWLFGLGEFGLDRELAEVRSRVAEREKGGPVSTWSTADMAQSREDPAKARRLLQILTGDSRRSESAG
jgi:hypothetical protein